MGGAPRAPTQIGLGHLKPGNLLTNLWGQPPPFKKKPPKTPGKKTRCQKKKGHPKRIKKKIWAPHKKRAPHEEKFQ